MQLPNKIRSISSLFRFIPVVADPDNFAPDHASNKNNIEKKKLSFFLPLKVDTRFYSKIILCKNINIAYNNPIML